MSDNGCSILVDKVSFIACSIERNNTENLPKFNIYISHNSYQIPNELIWIYFDSTNETSHNYLLKIQFANEDNWILVQPFFFIYHTLFDDENNKIQFYPVNVGHIETVYDYSSIYFTFVTILFVVFFVLVCFYFINLYKKKNSPQHELKEPSAKLRT